MEEEARREAIQRAAVEQARITVEARTRAEESERERRHEIELQRMRAETVKKPGPGGYVASALGGAAATLALCLVLHFAVSKPASDRRIAELDRAVAGAEGREAELGRRVDDQKARIGQLEKSLSDMQDELSMRPPVQATTLKVPVGPKRGGIGTGRDRLLQRQRAQRRSALRQVRSPVLPHRHALSRIALYQRHVRRRREG